MSENTIIHRIIIHIFFLSSCVLGAEYLSAYHFTAIRNKSTYITITHELPRKKLLQMNSIESVKYAFARASSSENSP